MKIHFFSGYILRAYFGLLEPRGRGMLESMCRGDVELSTGVSLLHDPMLSRASIFGAESNNFGGSCD